ncbi:MAG: TetR/AcrR family transcriptional regulator [Pseudomonadota bacterium]
MHGMNEKAPPSDHNATEKPPRNAYHHGDLRAALIEHTRRLVEEKGPDHFSVSEVARCAGVSTAAPYRHFRDRDEILAEVCIAGMRRHYSQMINALKDVPKGSLERLRGLGRVYVQFAQEEPGVFRLIFGSKQKPDSVEELKSEDIDTYGLVKAEVAEILGLPAEHPEANRRAFMLWTFVHGLSFLIIDDNVRYAGIPIDVEALLDELGQRVMRDLA